MGSKELPQVLGESLRIRIVTVVTQRQAAQPAAGELRGGRWPSLKVPLRCGTPHRRCLRRPPRAAGAARPLSELRPKLIVPSVELPQSLLLRAFAAGHLLPPLGRESLIDCGFLRVQSPARALGICQAAKRAPPGRLALQALPTLLVKVPFLLLRRWTS